MIFKTFDMSLKYNGYKVETVAMIISKSYVLTINETKNKYRSDKS